MYFMSTWGVRTLLKWSWQWKGERGFYNVVQLVGKTFYLAYVRSLTCSSRRDQTSLIKTYDEVMFNCLLVSLF